MIELVSQQDRRGCVIACCAMICGKSYEDVATTFSDPDRGFTHDACYEYLARHGFAMQHHYRVDPITGVERKPWPLPPWADIHVCAVDSGCGPGSHMVVLLRSGRVLDPATSEPRTLEAYASVSYMAGIFQVSSALSSQTDACSALSALEAYAVTSLASSWAAFCRLPRDHPDDLNDFRRGIHALQDQILSRPARRALNVLSASTLRSTALASPPNGGA